MKFREMDDMSPVQRREFLKFVTGLIALPMISPRTREAIAEVILGSQAHAQAMTPMNFLEVNFRDQWDFQCLFVPPGVAANYANASSRMPPAGAPIAERNNFFVTPNATELRPHLDNIAVIETAEICVGSVHAHEAANPCRSPGRSYSQTAGKIDMSTVDKRPGGREAGNETYYSATPTPAVLHNYYNKMMMPSLTNGVILRGTLRADIHTYYHFEGNLANAQPDRFFDRDTFLNNFNGTTVPAPTSSVQKHGALVAQFVKRLDDSYLQRLLESAARTKQSANADALKGLMTTVPPMPLALRLSAAEEAMWKTGIGLQATCSGDDGATCMGVDGKWHPAELFAYAGKLFQSGRIKTAAIDFDFTDFHTNRTKYVMDTQAQQSGMTLARLINYLKGAGLWDSTIIAMFTLDGSRSMETSSTGENAKNAVILAGGKIKGGYYGDIRFTNNQFYYHRPDDNGIPVAGGTTGGDMRVPSADIYKTVMYAAGIPMTVIDGFSDARGGKVLNYLLR